MAEANRLLDPFGNPMPEARSYQPAWHDRVVNYLTNALYGDNANAQQRERVNLLAGPDNPFNIPAQVNQGYNTLAQGVALRDPAQAGIGVAQMAMSLPFGIGKAPAQAATKGIRAYHGSPHDFDRFSLDKIGTGEGAQAYGHGLYFAENEGVAKSYRNTLGTWGNEVKHRVSDNLGINLTDDAASNFQSAAMAARGDPARAAKLIQWRVPETRALPIDKIELVAKQLHEIDRPGRMYEVNIKADPNDFLDWDKPLSQQSEKVRDALAGRGYDLEKFGSKTGSDIVQYGFGAKGQERAELMGAGVPGIRYLDQQSRFSPANLPNNPIANEAREFLKKAGGDPVAARKLFDQSSPHERWATTERDQVRKVLDTASKPATSNYVVFDDSLIEILRKYGLAGLMAGGAAATASTPADAKQQ